MSYVDDVLAQMKEKDAHEPEFLQVLTEILDSLRPIIEANEEKYRKEALLERLVEPEKVAYFRVPWTDDQGQAHINRGWRVQFNSAIGPYKGGIRFHPTVNLSVLKFLAFEQMFKNSLTGLPIGGGKEIGYMFGYYKRLVGEYDAGALSGKPVASGGSLGRNTATGYGAVYFTEELLNTLGKKIEGTTFCLSGFGNVSWGVAKKLDQLGGKVVAISGPDGYVYDPEGISGEKADYMVEMRNSLRDRVQDYADKYPSAQFHAGEKPWGRVNADIYMPCATQNDIRLEDAERMIAENHSSILVEVANMPTTLEAIELLKSKGWVIAPSKAVNAGGVAVSAMEMSQNAMKMPWTEEEVEDKLHPIMKNIFKNINAAAEKYGKPGDLIAGANLAAAERVLQAMEEQGIC